MLLILLFQAWLTKESRRGATSSKLTLRVTYLGSTLELSCNAALELMEDRHVGQ
jgi:hypothetical protein